MYERIIVIMHYVWLMPSNFMYNNMNDNTNTQLLLFVVLMDYDLVNIT